MMHSAERPETKFPLYPATQQSGIEWFGAIPAHWWWGRLKDGIEGCQNGIWGDEPDGETDIPCVRVADFDRVNYRVHLEEPTLRAVTQRERAGRVLRPGDLLLEKSGGGDIQPVGAVVVYDHDEEAVCSNFVARMPVRPGFDSRFLAYLHAHLYASRVNTRSIKQSTGIQNLTSDAYLSEAVPYPSLPEQRAIAAFLDRETEKIDTLIAKKERLIELLQEQRAAVITRAVTQGLDPNVPMKDSGVEWLGEVPAHWEVSRFKFGLRGVTSGSRGWADYYADTGAWFIRIGNVSGRSINLKTDGMQRVELPSKVEGRRTRVSPGDVMVTITANIGDVATAPNTVPEAYVNQHIALCRPRASLLDGRFAAYFLLTAGASQFELLLQGGTKDGLNLDDVANLQLVFPPIAEQRNIASHLDERGTMVTALLSTAEQATQRLSEYRTALISAAVTGKIDVRGETE